VIAFFFFDIENSLENKLELLKVQLTEISSKLPTREDIKDIILAAVNGK